MFEVCFFVFILSLSLLLFLNVNILCAIFLIHLYLFISYQLSWHTVGAHQHFAAILTNLPYQINYYYYSSSSPAKPLSKPFGRSSAHSQHKTKTYPAETKTENVYLRVKTQKHRQGTCLESRRESGEQGTRETRRCDSWIWGLVCLGVCWFDIWVLPNSTVQRKVASATAAGNRRYSLRNLGLYIPLSHRRAQNSASFGYKDGPQTNRKSTNS